MKKVILSLMSLFFMSCNSSKVKDVASFEFDNAWYWVIQYEKGATKQEIEDYVNTWANPNQTSFFFVFDDTVNLSFFSKERFSLQSFRQTVLLNNPKFGYYKMLPTDDKLYTDGIWLMKQANK